jgi:hypothetical protein
MQSNSRFGSYADVIFRGSIEMRFLKGTRPTISENFRPFFLNLKTAVGMFCMGVTISMQEFLKCPMPLLKFLLQYLS